jgi:hypothetical protein
MILGITDKIENGPSWRFVDKSVKMENSPWPFREVISHAALLEEKMDNSFIAVKVGDVDGTASANVKSTVTQPRSKGVVMSVEDRAVKAGEVVEVTLSASQFTEVYGMQLTLRHEGLELMGVDGRAIELNNEYVGKVRTNATTMSWASGQAKTIAQGSEVMRLVFRASKATKLSEALQITSDVTGAEAYVGQDMERTGVSLEVRGKEGLPFAVAQNEPNPWKSTTMINYDLPESGVVKLTVTDVTGKVITEVITKGEAGKNQVMITREQLRGATGVMIYQIESGSHTAQKKMLVIE